MASFTDFSQSILDVLLGSVDNAVALAELSPSQTPALLRINHAFARLLHLDDHMAELQPPPLPADIISATFQEALKAAAHAGRDWSGPATFRCGDGQTRAFDLTIKPVPGHQIIGQTQIIGQAGESVIFVTLLKDRGGESVGLDSLTGLPNRFLFHDRAAQALIQSQRIGKSVSLLQLGLDRFTRINDALGYGFGDKVLKEVARRLSRVIRQSDTGGRLDGDRFAVVTPITAVNDSVIVAEKVLKAQQEPFVIDGQEVVVTASVGIAIYPNDGRTADDLLKQSDSALHHAKLNGSNRYQFYANEMNNRAQQRLKLERDMRRALANNEFLVYYQPKVDIESERVKGAEALIRWQDPERGMVSPGEFIPVAEETGMIEEIGLWVLRETCRQNKEWQRKGLKPIRISVNVSAHQFRARDLFDKVKGALSESGLEAQWLELEITESMLMHNVEEAVTKMQTLRDLGLHLSIDDFGTGYSSLSYLGRFPITTLKIDRAFIHDVETNPNTKEIARAIIGLSRGLSLDVVAEGAEIAPQIQFLREHGCDVVQGFFYSRPLPAAEFEAMLRRSERGDPLH